MIMEIFIYIHCRSDQHDSFQVQIYTFQHVSKNPNNFLVSLGINDEYIFFKHRDYKGIPNRKVIQDILDKTTLLVGHNIKFDFSFTSTFGSF